MSILTSYLTIRMGLTGEETTRAMTKNSILFCAKWKTNTFTKAGTPTVQTSDVGTMKEIKEAKLLLNKAEFLLSSDKLSNYLDETLYYNLMREIRNVIVGVDICEKIVGSDDGRPTGT